jgi:hypothetical protein
MTYLKQNLKWALVFLAIVALCAALLVVHGMFLPKATYAQIFQDVEFIKTVELTNSEYEFTVSSEDSFNTIRVENGKIGVISASCPDKICVNQGFIDSGMVPIVCLPNKLSIVIKGASDTDAVVGGA